MGNLFGQDNIVRDISRKIFSEEFRWRVTGYLRNQNLTRPEMPTKVRRQLIELFKGDIFKLQDLIEKDLSIWLN